MKVKIFSSTISTDDLENKIAEWTKDLSPNIISTSVTVSPMHDFYCDSEPRVCNQWIEYIAVITYK